MGPPDAPEPPRVQAARGWVGLLLPLAERGGPIVSLLLCVLLLVLGWYFLGEVRRLRTLTLDIWERLMRCQTELARHCPPREER